MKIILSEVLSRVGKLSNVSTDAEIANVLGVSPQTLSTWKRRETIPYEKVCDFAVLNDVSLDYLLLGSSSAKSVSKNGFIDSELFNKIIQMVRSNESELNGVRLDLLIEHIVSIYNNVIQCESESEKNRMLNAQLRLLNLFALNHFLQNIENSPHKYDGIEKVEQELKGRLALLNDEHKSSETSVTQSITGSGHEIAGRDINKGK